MANADDVLERLEQVEQGLGRGWREDLIRDLAAAVREARRRIVELEREWDYLDRLRGGPYFVVRLDAADALNRENVERYRGMGIIRLLDADAAMGGEG